MKKALILSVALVASLFALSPALALSWPGQSTQPDPAIVDGSAAGNLKQARIRWVNSGVRSYRFRTDLSCFCRGTMTAVIRVRSGRAVKPSPDTWTGPRTVPQMFRVVGRAIRQRVESLDVTYDRKLGFPRQVSVDPVLLMADEEFAFSISWLKPAQTTTPR